jgi:hypothetical protein
MFLIGLIHFVPMSFCGQSWYVVYCINGVCLMELLWKYMRRDCRLPAEGQLKKGIGMTQKERLLKALKQEVVDRPPASVPTQSAIAEIMEKSGYAWTAAQKRARDMAGLAWACHEIGGIESVRIPFDITVEAEAMGCETKFGDDSGRPQCLRPKRKYNITRSGYRTLF